MRTSVLQAKSLEHDVVRAAGGFGRGAGDGKSNRNELRMRHEESAPRTRPDWGNFPRLAGNTVRRGLTGEPVDGQLQ